MCLKANAAATLRRASLGLPGIPTNSRDMIMPSSLPNTKTFGEPGISAFVNAFVSVVNRYNLDSDSVLSAVEATDAKAIEIAKKGKMSQAPQLTRTI